MTAAFNLSQFANKVNTSGQADLTTAVTGVLPAANGGTGLSSAGASGNVLQSNGTTWASVAIGNYIGNHGAIAFNGSVAGESIAFVSTGNANFTVPSGITAVKVTVIGGGGGGRSQGSGGSGCCAWTSSGAGGGAGGTSIRYITGLTPGTVIPITVGAAGAANASGGSSSFSTYATATGGATGSAVGTAGSASGTGGTGASGNINITGEYGDPVVGATAYTAARGGSSMYGNGGVRTSGTASGSSIGATGYGAGGGGGSYYWNGSGFSAIAATAGTAGIVIVEW